MKFYVLFVFVSLLSVVLGQLQSCQFKPPDVPREWVSMADKCELAMRQQIQEELTASMTYLAMGAYFSRDTINRPGFADLFFKSATEEREHAIKLLEYLLMRGKLTERLTDLIRNPKPKDNNIEWNGGLDALKAALNLETHVTKKIRDIIITCENAKNVDSKQSNDYHLVDYLTGVYLEEQYHGQRELAGHISTLGKMYESHGALAEFLFDKKLLQMNLTP